MIRLSQGAHYICVYILALFFPFLRNDLCLRLVGDCECEVYERGIVLHHPAPHCIIAFRGAVILGAGRQRFTELQPVCLQIGIYITPDGDSDTVLQSFQRLPAFIGQQIVPIIRKDLFVYQTRTYKVTQRVLDIEIIRIAQVQKDIGDLAVGQRKVHPAEGVHRHEFIECF